MKASPECLPLEELNLDVKTGAFVQADHGLESDLSWRFWEHDGPDVSDHLKT